MKTNNLTYKTSKQIKGGRIDVSIRLNDECKNGHQNFAITGDIWRHKTDTADRWYESGGCIHDEILKHFPKFKPFINLHLCDYKGIPMHCVANGVYHLKEGFQNLNGKTPKQYFCDYYRVSPSQYDTLATSENQLEYAVLLKDLGVLSQWEKEANKAIKQLEELTGHDFDPDSERTQYNEPDPEAVKEFRTKKEEDYYTPEAKAERAVIAREEAKQKQIKKFTDRADKIIDKDNNNKTVDLWLLEHLDKISKKSLKVSQGFSLGFDFDNYIYYDHTNTIKFNWREPSSFNKTMTETEFNMVCDAMKPNDFHVLPNNITLEFGEVKMYGC